MIIRNLVSQSNVSHAEFSKFVILVKRWAQARNLYGKNYCCPSGIAWTIMCACVCQKFPLLQAHKSKFEEDTEEGTTIMLLTCFFKLFSKWTWPNPIFLT
jgi:poly(A) polymerase Pap1